MTALRMRSETNLSFSMRLAHYDQHLQILSPRVAGALVQKVAFRKLSSTFLDIELHIGNHDLMGVPFMFMCSNIYGDIQKNSMQVWKFHVYDLVEEYKTKPAMAPPFNVLVHLWRILPCMKRKSSPKGNSNL